MKNYDKDNVPEKVIAELGLLMEDPLFTPEAMIAGSQERSGGVEGGGAAAEEPVRGEIAVCAAICGWARFIYAWHGVAKEAMPLREQLSLDEGKLAEKVSDVARLESSKLRIKEVLKK